MSVLALDVAIFRMKEFMLHILSLKSFGLNFETTGVEIKNKSRIKDTFLIHFVTHLVVQKPSQRA